MAAYIDALGDASVIRYGELPDPVAGAGQVLVCVEAVPVNHVDTYLRSGRWRTEVSFPLVLGRDLVGTVAAVGVGVTGVEPGQWVWTNSAGYGGRSGATAELVAAQQDRLYRLPDGADPVAFVAAVHPGATAHGALLGRARLQAGETVAVIGANGAVGLCMVQLAASCGARVVAVVRDRRAEGRLRALGAERVMVAQATQALAAAAEGLDLLVDTTGRGRLSLDLWPLYTREIQLLGFVMSRMTATELAAAAEWINETYPQHALSVPMGTVMTFAEAGQAHALVESGQLSRTAEGVVARIILRP